MPSLIGLIRNPAATRAGAGAPAGANLVARAPGDFAALDGALREMKAAGIGALAIEGGDGTVREVLGRALPLWSGAPPPFAIVAAGNTNLIARSAGRARGAALARLLEPGRAKRRGLHVLRVDRAGAPDIRGFILGAGVYVAATRLAREEIAARHGAQVLLAALRVLRSPALGAAHRIGFAAGAPAGDPAPRALVAMTSLPGALLLGLNPFGGRGGEGRIRWLDIAANPPRPLLAAPFLALGGPRRWMSDAYRRGVAEHAELRLDAPFIVDGEEFTPGTDGRVRVSATECVTFLSDR
ncbi:MAG: diacylglycerol kinase family protein [Pikeienuella sp.]